MYEKLIILIDNNVYLKNMLFGKVFDLKVHVILTHTWFFLMPLWCLKFVILKIHQKRLHSYVKPILFLKFYYFFRFPMGYQVLNTQCIILPVMDF
jgi:hypothetical protein